ncbi:MAG TPA: histidine--tRNA ligase [bacterium]
MPLIKPSLPKGTRDFLPEEMIRRQSVIATVRTVFERYGYQPLETPAIEKLEVLSGKYGEEGEQLIFKVLKRGTGLEELLQGRKEFAVEHYDDLVDEALRYDLTVPLSRVVAMHENEIVQPFKRYQIQPVWRADRPQRGRYREFYQCDVDSVGVTSMLADAEIIAMVYQVLSSLGFNKFKIRLNNRKILNGIIKHGGIPPASGNAVFVAIDKLDKIGPNGVKQELLDRGLSDSQIQKIFSVFALSDNSLDVLAELAGLLDGNEELQSGAEELTQIMKYLDSLGVNRDAVRIDLYLARGLGYYTGPIHEAVVEEPKMGSLSGGGRYDRLIGMFLGRDIPATGVAFGIERIIDVMNELNMFSDSNAKTKALVTLFDESTVDSSLILTQELRMAGVNAEHFLELSKLKKQFVYADKKRIPYVVIIGPDELAEGRVTIKTMSTGEQRQLPRSQALSFLASA